MHEITCIIDHPCMVILEMQVKEKKKADILCNTLSWNKNWPDQIICVYLLM